MFIVFLSTDTNLLTLNPIDIQFPNNDNNLHSMSQVPNFDITFSLIQICLMILSHLLNTKTNKSITIQFPNISYIEK